MKISKHGVLTPVLCLAAATASASSDGPIHPNGPDLAIPFMPWAHVQLPYPLTAASVWMTAVAVFLIVLFWSVRRGAEKTVPTGMYNLLEMVVEWVRDEIAIKNIGEHDGRRFTPFLLTVFFFIYGCNLAGLLPGAYTVTSNINVTAALALITLVTMQVSGIKQYGFAHHIKNLVPSGIPKPLIPLMFLVEVLGVIAKPFALCVRLFANMTAGHVIILSLLSLIFTVGAATAPVWVAFALFIYLLELLVAFLQAYIFTMLTSLFIGMTVHVSH